MVADDRDQPGNRQADEDHVLHDGHADLGPGGDLDAHDRDDEHDDADRRG
jgi:hypothetical protein